MPGMESQLSAQTLSKETVSTGSLELNQLIPHITHMVELEGASVGPQGIAALPPPPPASP